jgi:hypothetical protein
MLFHLFNRKYLALTDYSVGSQKGWDGILTDSDGDVVTNLLIASQCGFDNLIDVSERFVDIARHTIKKQIVHLRQLYCKTKLCKTQMLNSYLSSSFVVLSLIRISLIIRENSIKNGVFLINSLMLTNFSRESYNSVRRYYKVKVWTA